jgi:hypothetical protein
LSSVIPPYEPEVIERFAAQLDARAQSLQRGITIAGCVLGALVGAVPLTPLGVAWPIPEVFGFATLIVGLLCGGLIGFVVGSGRAELHRLHAQTVLCQLHAQRATLAIWKLLREREDAPQASHVAQTPVQQLAAPASRQFATPAPAPTPTPAPPVAAPLGPPQLRQPTPDLAPPPVSIRSA